MMRTCVAVAVLLGHVSVALPASKAGIATRHLNSDTPAIKSSNISWAYNWYVQSGVESKDLGNLQYVPMIWGHSPMFINRLGDMPNVDVMLGFNEPNDPHQSHHYPKTAAKMWPEVEAAAEAHGVRTLVGPAVNYAVGKWHDPVAWYDEFLRECSGCRIDAIAIHVYNCGVSYMRDRIELFRRFNKPLWITEFSCGDNPEAIVGCGDKSWQCQCQYMSEVIPYLESEPLVAGYAWFSQGLPGSPDRYVGESSLVANGRLTDLGECYSNLVGSSTRQALESPQSFPDNLTLTDNLEFLV